MKSDLLSIGEFSRATSLTVKTLRFYHESGLIVPVHVDKTNGYRFYNKEQLELAQVVRIFRELDFSIDEIREVLTRESQKESLVGLLEKRKASLQEAIRIEKDRLKKLEEILVMQRQLEVNLTESHGDVIEKQIGSQLVASLRHVGAYSECGQLYKKLARQYGRFLCGKPMLLCWDGEYKEQANYEVLFPVRPCKPKAPYSVYELPGGDALTFQHVGRYEDISRSYQRLLLAAKERDWNYALPTREIYLKGPGMIFRGNPNHYITELQFVKQKDHQCAT